jgi:hypothetical protein
MRVDALDREAAARGQHGDRTRAEEAHMAAMRVDVQVLPAGAHQGGRPARGVRGADQPDAARTQHAQHVARERQRVLQVLDHLEQRHGVEAAGFESCAVQRAGHDIETLLARAGGGSGRGFDAACRDAHALGRLEEGAARAADIEQPEAAARRARELLQAFDPAPGEVEAARLGCIRWGGSLRGIELQHRLVVALGRGLADELAARAAAKQRALGQPYLRRDQRHRATDRAVLKETVVDHSCVFQCVHPRCGKQGPPGA